MRMESNSGGGGGADSELTVVKSKLVVVGDCGCGKTSLIDRYVNGKYSDVSKTLYTTCV